MKKVVIYYFSGCGNSKWVAQNAAAKFQEKGLEALAVNTEGKYISQNADFVGFVFPIYSFGLPKFAVDFLKTVPTRPNQVSFLLTVPSLHEGIGILQGNFILKRRGADLVYARSIYMPDSWTMFFDAPGDEEFNTKTERALQDIERAVRQMLAVDRNMEMINPLAIPVLGAVYGVFYYMGRHLLGKCFVITNKCNSCRICHDVCPARSIQWRKNKPYWDWGCQQCFRCLNRCPKNAIEVAILPVLVMLFTLFFGVWLYGVVTPNFMKKPLEILWILPPVFFWFVLNYTAMWLVHKLGMNNLMPDLFFTSKRKRYKRLLEQQRQSETQATE